MSLRHPVITGTGIICAVGGSVGEVWEALRNGQSGLGPLTLFDSARYGAHPVGQVRQDVDRLAGRVRGSRSDKLAWIAAQQALREAGLGAGLGSVPPVRAGVVLGSTVGGMLGTERFLTRLLREGRHRFGPLRFHECAGASEICARQLGARGPCATVSTACSAGAMAIAMAGEMIAAGEADLMLAGGGDSLCRLTLNGFGSLLLLDPQGCRPFDARRAGLSLGEGAAVLVLEDEAAARARGARILARLSGWGASCDAWHATAPHPEGRGALAAMQQALGRAGLESAAIDFVSAHGTGTPDNDAMEVTALKRLFSDRLPPVASVKRFFGHTLAASGPIKAVVCVRALQEQAIPPNPGFEQVDPKLGLEPVREFRARPLTHVLSNSFGFGGNNVALILSTSQGGSDEAGQVARPTEYRGGERSAGALAVRTARAPLAVFGAGVVGAAGSTLSEVYATFRHGGAPVSLFAVAAAGCQARAYASGDFGADQFIEPGKRRKLSRLQQMALVAARQSLLATARTTNPQRTCVALGTGLGSLNDTAAFVENMVLKDERAPRPLFFTNSVHNALASHVAIELSLTGLNSTPVQREICFETALWQGANELALGHAELALVGAADELNQYALAPGLRWGWWDDHTQAIQPFAKSANPRERPLPGEGCALFTLARLDPAVPVKPWATVSSIGIGRFATTSSGQIDVAAEAQWLEAMLERDGGSLAEADLLLTGANGWGPLDGAYQEIAAVLGRRAGRPIPCGAYKHCCGEFHSASAFGFLTALGLVRGEIPTAACLFPERRSTEWAQYDATAGARPSSGAATYSKGTALGAFAASTTANVAAPEDGRAPMPLDRPCRTVVLYTLSPTGGKAICCVRG